MNYLVKLLVATSLGLALLPACDRVKSTAKNTIRKTGETVGQSATVLADGLATGAEREAAHLELSPALQARGLAAGKSSTSRDDNSQTTNRLSMYIIFNQAFRDTVTVKLFDSQNQEYGRKRVFVAGRRDDAHPVDVVFDSRTDFELGTRVVVE